MRRAETVRGRRARRLGGVPLRRPGGGDHQPRSTRATTSRSTRAARSTCSRRSAPSPTPPPLVFTSTNKVYGACDDVPLAESATPLRAARRGVCERGHRRVAAARLPQPVRLLEGRGRPVRARLRAHLRPAHGVFRMSCIYGPHQFGNEDQGWVAHFADPRARRASRSPSTATASRCATCSSSTTWSTRCCWRATCAEPLAGRAFNIGGGPANTISLLELLELMRELHGALPEIRFADVAHRRPALLRLGHPRARRATGWCPRVGVRDGVARLYDWLLESRGLSPTPPLPEAPRRAGRRRSGAPAAVRRPEVAVARRARTAESGRA